MQITHPVVLLALITALVASTVVRQCNVPAANPEEEDSCTTRCFWLGRCGTPLKCGEKAVEEWLAIPLAPVLTGGGDVSK